MESGPEEGHWGTPGTPRKSGFSAGKRPKEGERVALGHFHRVGQRVGESPRREKNFGTSGSKISLSFPRYGRLKLEFVLDQIN